MAPSQNEFAAIVKAFISQYFPHVKISGEAVRHLRVEYKRQPSEGVTTTAFLLQALAALLQLGLRRLEGRHVRAWRDAHRQDDALSTQKTGESLVAAPDTVTEVSTPGTEAPPVAEEKPLSAEAPPAVEEKLLSAEEKPSSPEGAAEEKSHVVGDTAESMSIPAVWRHPLPRRTTLPKTTATAK
ncbi:hypothetical protein P3T76_012152 [Phytophthora citrophthora]|uniref:Uncharacterized protein n=1 Tax=Phytophthora citrophthora TaxID=4793 RepID=A0AAD9G693_9STRA|nr:hypothetical protein P3T76_012152 [Phytophthora citrophthora]